MYGCNQISRCTRPRARSERAGPRGRGSCACAPLGDRTADRRPVGPSTLPARPTRAGLGPYSGGRERNAGRADGGRGGAPGLASGPARGRRNVEGVVRAAAGSRAPVQRPGLWTDARVVPFLW